MILDQDTVAMYEKSRTTQFVEELQKKISDLEGYCTRVNPQNGEMYQLPLQGATTIKMRLQRHEDIEADELQYGRRNMRPILMDKWLRLSTDDPLFLQNLPINLTSNTKQLANAAARVKDEILMGTCLSTADDETNGDYIVRTPTSLETDAEDGSPYKGGTTSGIFGDAYTGRYGDGREELPQQPRVVGSDDPIDGYGDYTESSVLDLKHTNVIPVNYAKEGDLVDTGFTLEKFLAARQGLKARYAEGTVCLAITHRQALDMLTDEKYQNRNYGFNILNSDVLSQILGVKIIVTDVLPKVNVGGTGESKWVRSCPMWIAEDLLFGVWQGAKFEIRQPQEKVDTIYTGVRLCMGSARSREESVVCIHCEEGSAVA